MSRQTILLVEDETDQRELLAELLDDEGYRVVHVSNARAALEVLRRESVALVIADQSLGDRVETGTWMLREARDANLLEGTATMLLSAHHRLRSSIPDRVLGKPLHIDALVHEVRALIASPSRTDAPSKQIAAAQ